MGSQTTTTPAAPSTGKQTQPAPAPTGKQTQSAPAPTGKATTQPAQPTLSLGGGGGNNPGWGIGAQGGITWVGEGPEPTGAARDAGIASAFKGTLLERDANGNPAGAAHDRIAALGTNGWGTPGVLGSAVPVAQGGSYVSGGQGAPAAPTAPAAPAAPAAPGAPGAPTVPPISAPPAYGTVPQNFGQTPSYKPVQMPGLDTSWSIPGNNGGGGQYGGGQWGGSQGGWGGDIPAFDRSQGDRVAQDYYDSAMMRLRPEQEKQREALDVKLRLQGLQPGTEAYNRAMQNQMISTGDVYAKLGLDSTGMGYQTASDIYGQNLTRQNNLANQGITSQNNLANQGITSQNNLANQTLQQRQIQQAYQEQLARQGIDSRYQDIIFQNNLANQGLQGSSLGIQSQNNLAQQFAEAARQRQREQQQMFDQSNTMYQRPFNEATFWQNQLGGAPSTNFNTFNPATNAGGLNLTQAQQAAYNAAMAEYNASQGGKNNLINAGAGIAGSALGGPMGGAIAKSIFG